MYFISKHDYAKLPDENPVIKSDRLDMYLENICYFLGKKMLSLFGNDFLSDKTIS